MKKLSLTLFLVGILFNVYAQTIDSTEIRISKYYGYSTNELSAANAANEVFLLDDLDGALKKINIALKVSPNYHAFLRIKAEILMKQKEYSDCEKICGNILKSLDYFYKEFYPALSEDKKNLVKNDYYQTYYMIGMINLTEQLKNGASNEKAVNAFQKMIEYNEKNLATPYTMISYSYAYNYATKQKKNDMAIGCEFFAKAKERLNNDIMSGPINLRYIKEIQKLIKCE